MQMFEKAFNIFWHAWLEIVEMTATGRNERMHVQI